MQCFLLKSSWSLLECITSVFDNAAIGFSYFHMRSRIIFKIDDEVGFSSEKIAVKQVDPDIVRIKIEFVSQ